MRLTSPGRAIFTVIFALGCLFFFSSAEANYRRGQLGITASILSGFPSANFSDLTNTGLGLGLELEYGITNTISAGFLFNYLPFQGPDIVQDSTLSEEWLVRHYGLYAKLYFEPFNELVPYLKGGAMITDYEADISRRFDDPNDTTDTPLDTTISGNGKLTAMFGVGLKWDLYTRLSFSGEILFTKFFEVVQDIQQVRQGVVIHDRHDVDAQYVSFNLMGSFYFGRKK